MTEPSDPLVLIRDGGSPMWSGWFAWGMAACCLIYRSIHVEGDASEKLGLAIVAGIFAVTGALILGRRYRQRISISRRDQRIVVEDSTRFSRSRKTILFRNIKSVELESYTDPDPDARPFQRTDYRVVLRLHDGQELPLSDFGFQEPALGFCTQVRELLGGSGDEKAGQRARQAEFDRLDG